MDKNFAIDINGNAFIKGDLIMIDKKTGREWQLYVSGGELKINPIDPIDIRDKKINEILNENISE